MSHTVQLYRVVALRCAVNHFDTCHLMTVAIETLLHLCLTRISPAVSRTAHPSKRHSCMMVNEGVQLPAFNKG